MREGQKHCILRCFCFPSATKTVQKWSRTDFKKHLIILASFFPAPDLQKRETQLEWRSFGGSTPTARPRVAKASCRLHAHTSRHRRILELTLIVGSGLLDPRFHRSYWMRTCFRNIFLMLFWKAFMESWNWNFVGNQCFFLGQVRTACSRKLLRRVFPKELQPISTFHFV